MTNVSDVLDWLDRKTQMSEDTTAMDLWQLFSELPNDLDLASAKFYLKKEYQRNDTGMDRRVEIYFDEPGVYEDELDDWDEDYDEDASWREDYY